MVRDLAYRAIPFVIESSTLDLIASVQTGIKLVEDFGPLLIKVPCLSTPSGSSSKRKSTEDGPKSGVLIQKVVDKILVCSLHRTVRPTPTTVIRRTRKWPGRAAGGSLAGSRQPLRQENRQVRWRSDERASRRRAHCLPVLVTLRALRAAAMGGKRTEMLAQCQ